MFHHTRLVQGELPPNPLSIDRFHLPCLLPWRVLFLEARIGEDCRRTTSRPLTSCRQTGSSLLASHWRYFTTPTRRYHGRTFIRPSPPCGHPQTRCLHVRMSGTLAGSPPPVRGKPRGPLATSKSGIIRPSVELDDFISSIFLAESVSLAHTIAFV